LTWGTTAEQKVLSALLGGASLGAPATWYVGLSTTTITNAAGPTEPSGGAYARVAVTNNTTNFPAATGNTPATSSNGTTITFPASTASWGTVTYAFLADASSGGNVWFFGALTSSVNVNAAGFTLSFAANALSITLN
jgi:hypothetical protein